MSPGLREHWPAIEAWEGTSIGSTKGAKFYLVQHGEARRGFMQFPDGQVTEVGSVPAPAPEVANATEAVTCAMPTGPPQALPRASTTPAPSVVQTRVLRLALSCTGEYAAYHGGSTAAALAAMVAAVNRANAVFGPEMGIQFELVPENGDLVFLDAQTDPYNNANAAQMMAQNAATLNSILGSEAFDIGHVFGTGLSSIASLGSACGAMKARGVSRATVPVGEAFEVGQFCHELGHQLGASHTHSNPCNAQAATAFEPASGSTIMSYAGICSPNLQPLPDDEFHAHSLNEMRAFLTTGPGATLCPAPSGPINHAPQVVASDESRPVPPGTPFRLTASGTIDADFDVLTYSWDQADAGAATLRSLPPTLHPFRDFPSDAGSGGMGDGLGQTLPSPGDALTFLYSARDNRSEAGASGVDTMYIHCPSDPENVPFAVLNWVWDAEAQAVVLDWTPGMTAEAPFDDAWLEARLSFDGGLTYPFLLADSVPNTGHASLVWPAALADTASRLKLQPKDGSYFAISPWTLSPDGVNAPPAGANLQLLELTGLADTLCGHAVAPQAVVFNAGSTATNGFVLSFEDAVSGQTQLLESPQPLAPGEIATAGFTHDPSGWWPVGFGDHNITVTVTLLNGETDAHPDDNTLYKTFFTHCTANCPGCGCTSPAACNFTGGAIFPLEDSCIWPFAGDDCPCATALQTSATLSGGETAAWSLTDLANTPTAIEVQLDFDNAASPGSFAADFAFSLCAPNGDCVSLGGYNVPVPGSNIGSWPASWQSPIGGNFTAAINLEDAVFDEAGENAGNWTLTIFNGWSASNNVNYSANWSFLGMCAPTSAVAGCPGDLNGDEVVSVADLLVLLGGMTCAWDCPSVDLTGDGFINVADLLTFLGLFGTNC